MTEKINIIKMNGTNIQAELICLLENTLTRRQFVFYTLNEVMGAQPNSTVKIYVSKVSQNDPSLDNPISDAEWAELKGIMGEVLKGVDNPNLKYIKAEPTLGLACVSDKAIAMPTSYEYVSKHKNVYLNAILNPVIEEPAKEEVVEEIPVQDIVSSEMVVQEEPIMEGPAVMNEPIYEAASVAIPEEPNSYENTIMEPVIEPVIEPVMEQEVSEAVVENGPAYEAPAMENETPVSNYANMEFINIEEIEQKYNDMFESLNKLKEQELEAAKRYNATLELSAMHNEQHASYVASEQEKEVPLNQTNNEPMPVEPVPIEFPSEAANVNLETNWFDLPQNEN